MTADIDETTVVRDIVVEHPETRPVLERHGIDYCCGGESALGEAAAEQEVELDAVVADIQQTIRASQESGQPRRDWSKESLTDLIGYVESTHHGYLRAQLPRLDSLFGRVLEAHGERHGDVLRPLYAVFWGLRAEMEQHLMKEEQMLFPYLRHLDAAAREDGPRPQFPCGHVGGPIAQMRHEHENAGQALAKCRELTGDYTLPDDACESFSALYDGLQALEADLHEHIHLENNILFPRALALAPEPAAGARGACGGS
ncbi:MAG: iron-sulfur cluster repair di-iron protein [Planctomycetota bacterium]